MELEEKRKLLTSDLMSRVNYWNDLKVEYKGKAYTLFGYGAGRVTLLANPFMSVVEEVPLIEEVKPYLRPMESMTEEERKELISEFGADIRDEDNGRHTEEYGYVLVYHNFKEESWFIPFEAIDWLDAHHFDFRGLIKLCLALEAPTGMYDFR